MAAAGMNVVRMAEFAWNVLEPEPGTYDFSLFDETIDRLGEVGIDTILCTPTATPPRWLLDEMPDAVRQDDAGRPMSHGSRQHFSHAHEDFRRASIRITRAMAEHWKDDPRVIGWQTDNEFHCHFSEDYSQAAADGFVAWCRRRYGTIDVLNDAWGTAFWAQTYRDFADVGLPRKMNPTYLNPAHHLAYFRYLADMVARFQRDQVEVLREANADWWITHNGLFTNTDIRGPFGQDLDVFGFDTYPMFYPPTDRAERHAFTLDRVRGLTGNFIVLEHQAGAGGQTDYMLEQPLPGEMRQQAWRSIARGADSLLFFRWRTCRYGAEQYWLGLIDHDDIGRRRYEEASRLGEELKQIEPILLGTRVVIDAAVATGSNDVRAAHAACNLGLPDPEAVASDVHAAMLKLGLTPGCVAPDDELTGVGLYVLPHWAVVDETTADHLQQYVEAGGTVVIGARSGTRDIENNIVASTPPGVLSGLAGVTVEEYGPFNQDSGGFVKGGRSMHYMTDDATTRAKYWYELIDPAAGTDVLATWQGGAFHGRAAVSLRRVGSGRVVYVGTYLTNEACGVLLPTLAKDVERLRPADLAADVEYVRRVGDDGRILHIYLNNGEASTTIALPGGSRWILGDGSLPQFGVAVAVGVAVGVQNG